jgi:hypothetical protein
MREADLYPPIKAHLEAQGYEVKSEITGCDVVARRGDEPPVVVELKLGFTLALIYQAIMRQSVTDDVYVAIPPFSGKGVRGHRRDALALCRRLGLGLITVRPGDVPVVEVLADPATYQPRKSKPRQGRLLREFDRRVGDPNTGGASKRPLMTAYRQDALRCAALLAKSGPIKGADVAAITGVAKATTLMRRDVYGWFEATGTRGVYALSPKGAAALEIWSDALAALVPDTAKS